MVKKRYVPDVGDVVWIDLNPTKGREQAKRRPALVLSPQEYNKKTSLALMCPITSVKKGYPFEVRLADKKITGVVLADHVRSLDWAARNARLIIKAKPNVITEAQQKLNLLLGS